jgi:adenylate cyclase
MARTAWALLAHGGTYRAPQLAAAGDAVLAEFPSAVKAVRCAIDVQESLRTLPAEQADELPHRDHDRGRGRARRRPLGDGVNIAARLEGLAPPGGLCLSRSVHEQVFNKLSVKFLDIGQQEVKNIPTPIHALRSCSIVPAGTMAGCEGCSVRRGSPLGRSPLCRSPPDSASPFPHI